MTIPYITVKQQEIVLLYHRFRFLHRLHLQQLLHHKDKRRINSWLKDLVNKKYLENIDQDSSNSYEQIKNSNKLAAYRIGINGIRFLKTQDDIDKSLLYKLYREKDRSNEFVNHSLLLAGIFLNLSADTKTADSLTFYTQSDYASNFSLYNFLTEPLPDAYIKRRVGKSKTRQYLLHIIEESTLRFRSYKLRKKIRDYLSFYFSNSWENHTKTSFPTILFILPDMPALIYLQRFIQKILNENTHPKIHFWLCTKPEIQKQGFTNVEWEEVE